MKLRIVFRGAGPRTYAHRCDVDDIRACRCTGTAGVTGGRVATVREIGRTQIRKMLGGNGIVDEPAKPSSGDPAEVAQLLAAPWYDQRLTDLADELGRDHDGVRAESAGYLREMAATLDDRAVQAWRRFSRWPPICSALGWGTI